MSFLGEALRRSSPRAKFAAKLAAKNAATACGEERRNFLWNFPVMQASSIMSIKFRWLTLEMCSTQTSQERAVEHIPAVVGLSLHNLSCSVSVGYVSRWSCVHAAASPVLCLIVHSRGLPNRTSKKNAG